MERRSYGRLCVNIGNHLTTEMMQRILLKVDTPIGIASRYSADQMNFWAYLAGRGLFDRDNLNLKIWEDYPGIVRLICEAKGEKVPTVPPSVPYVSSNPTSISNPLQAVVRKTIQSKRMTAGSFHRSYGPPYSHFRTAIYLAMNESEAWYEILNQRGLLTTESMVEWVAKVKSAWRQRANNPTQEVMDALCEDPEFANQALGDFGNSLIQLNLKEVTYQVKKLAQYLGKQDKQDQEKNITAYTAQKELRTWFLENKICQDEEVDTLILKVRKEGVKQVDDLEGFDKNDLKECGFNTRQAIAIVKTMTKK